MILLYEEGGIDVDSTLVAQYIQDDEITERFMQYYTNYVEFYNKYMVDEILDGNVTEDIIASAHNAQGAEKDLLFGMIIESVSRSMKESLEMEKMFKELQPILQDTIVKLNANFSNREILSHHIMSEQSKLQKLTRAKVISPANKRVMHWIIYSLGIYMDKTTKCRDNMRAVQTVIQEFSATLNKMKAVTDGAIKKMQNAFTFVEAVYDNGKEMVMLYNELKQNYHSRVFMKKYGFKDYCGGPAGVADYSQIEKYALEPNPSQL